MDLIVQRQFAAPHFIGQAAICVGRAGNPFNRRYCPVDHRLILQDQAGLRSAKPGPGAQIVLAGARWGFGVEKRHAGSHTGAQPCLDHRLTGALCGLWQHLCIGNGNRGYAAWHRHLRAVTFQCAKGIGGGPVMNAVHHAIRGQNGLCIGAGQRIVGLGRQFDDEIVNRL